MLDLGINTEIINPRIHKRDARKINRII